MYRLGFTPWDSGVPPPELRELIEGADARTPGKALDLGCGTGTNAIYMTQHGWDVTAIGDVTRLDELNVGDGYSLVFDLGCLHAIPQSRRDEYVAGVNKRTLPGADYLIWGFYAKLNPVTNARISREEVEQRFGASWELVRAWGGAQPDRFPGRWYHLKKK